MSSKLIGGLAIACIAIAGAIVTLETSAQGRAQAVRWSIDDMSLGSGPEHPVILWGDPSQPGAEGFGMLITIPAGSPSRMHAHPGDYYGINVKGTWVWTEDGVETVLPQGSYVFQPGEQFHDDSCAGPEDCVLFIHQHVPAGMYFPNED